ncbi:MAG: GtrA family protein [Pseudomonadota bacterium]
MSVVEIIRNGVREGFSSADRARLLEEFWRIFRFGIVGVAATITHALGVFAFVELAGLSPSLANPVAFVIAVPVSYFGHYFFTYGASSAHGETMLRFIAVSGTSFAVSQVIVMGMEALGGPYEIAVAIFVVLVPATNFVLFNLLVFRRRGE